MSWQWLCQVVLFFALTLYVSSEQALYYAQQAALQQQSITTTASNYAHTSVALTDSVVPAANDYSAAANVGSTYRGPLAPEAYGLTLPNPSNAYLPPIPTTIEAVPDVGNAYHHSLAPEVYGLPLANPSNAYLPPIPTTIAPLPSNAYLPPPAYVPQAPKEVYHTEFYSFNALDDSAVSTTSTTPVEPAVHKNVRVIFIKTPEQKAIEQTLQNLAAQRQQEKTAIYVFNKELNHKELASKYQQLQQHNAKPEVNFIKYSNAEQAAFAEQAIRQKYAQLAGETTTASHQAQPAAVMDYPEHWQVTSGGNKGYYGEQWPAANVDDTGNHWAAAGADNAATRPAAEQPINNAMASAHDSANGNAIDAGVANMYYNNNAYEISNDVAQDDTRYGRLMNAWLSDNHIVSKLNERFRTGSRIRFPDS